MDTTVSIPLALMAGVVAFASPCFLPVVPAFVANVVGESGSSAPVARRRALMQSLVFIGGFTAVFVAIWVSIGLIGNVVGPYRSVLRIGGGVILVFMGLHVAEVVRIPFLDRLARPQVASSPGAPPSYARSALMGLAFAAGWTPCIGPVLGAVLGMATASQTVGEGAVLLLAFSLGLGIPFALVALGATAVSVKLGWFTRHHRFISILSGVLITTTGLLMITNLFERLTALVPQFGL